MAATDDERNLVVLSQSGDHGAYETLIGLHQRMIHSLCYRMTGSLADAEDLAQETFIHGYLHLSAFRAEARFSSWLYRIAVNQCLNWQKRRLRDQERDRDWSEQLQGGAETDCPEAALVQEALMRLDPKQRAAVILTIYDGLTHAEAAKALRCSETTVSWRVFAARRKLKQILRRLQPSPPGR